MDTIPLRVRSERLKSDNTSLARASTVPRSFHRASNSLAGGIVGGRYVLGKSLGEGAIGKVYQATDTFTDMQVAVKISKDWPNLPPDLIVREALELCKIRHENIVTVTESGFFEGRAYVVMELLEGETLEEYMERTGSLSWEDAKRITAQICAGLHVLHEHGIIHRDIKPNNIFITEDGTVKLIDFDISQFKFMEHEDDERKTEGIFWGNPNYASPEQASGRTDFDHRVDIYALGTLMYKMLSEVLPFNADNPASLLLARLNYQPTHLKDRLVGNSIPEAAVDLVMRAISKEPEGRFSDMAALLNAIKLI